MTADHRSEGRPGYDRDLAALLQANYREAARAADSLRVSLRRTQTLFPIAAQTLESLDEEAKERAEALNLAQTGAIGLIETLARLRAYAVGHIGLPPDTLPLV